MWGPDLTIKAPYITPVPPRRDGGEARTAQDTHTHIYTHSHTQIHTPSLTGL